MSEHRNKTVALITGANKGIGRGAAGQLDVLINNADGAKPTGGFFGEEGRIPW